MIISVNTPIEELLKLWATISYKIFNNIEVNEEDTQLLNKVRTILDAKGINCLEIFNINENIYKIRYFKYGSEFIKEIQVSK